MSRNSDSINKILESYRSGVKAGTEYGLKHRAYMWVTYVIMTFVLAVLKLTGYIGITWLWVFSPIWLPPAIMFSILFGFLALVLLVAAVVFVGAVVVVGSQMLWEKWTK